MSVARETSQSPADPPTAPLVSAGSSDRCPVCGAHLAVDQRYCVECGTRRGAPRFALAGSSVGSASASAPPPRNGVVQRFTRSSSSASLLIGLLILLVALGIGVLIGHNGNSVKPANPKVSVVVNGGASSGSASSGAATPAASTGSSSGTKATGSTAKATKKTTSKKAATKAAAANNPNAAAKGKAGAAAAAKSFSTTATKKSTVGGSCTAGTAGCKNGKQTGNLF